MLEDGVVCTILLHSAEFALEAVALNDNTEAHKNTPYPLLCENLTQLVENVAFYRFSPNYVLLRFWVRHMLRLLDVHWLLFEVCIL